MGTHNRLLRLGPQLYSGPVYLHPLKEASTPHLLAHIQTPNGLKTLPFSRT
jgi:hypothetical protein